MKQFLHLSLLGLVLLLTGCQDVVESPSGLPPYRFKFGVVQNGQIIVVAENRIPFRPGTEYGWTLDLQNPGGTVLVKEVFTLPSPTAWKFDNLEKMAGQTEATKTEKIRIEESGQVFSKEMEVTADETVSHLSTYKILASDPLGSYRLELFLNGQPAIVLEFTLVKDEGEKKVRLS